MEVKTLGSVSPHSYKDKNGVGYLVNDDGYKVLLDAGSGITRLMNMDVDLNNLIIKISHLHVDHVEELLALSHTTYVRHNLGLLKERIKVYIPEFGDSIGNEVFVKLLLENTLNYFEFITYDKYFKIQHGNMTITSSGNPHDVKCFSTKIENGKESMVYSGDTGFNNNSLIKFANNTGLFICESTFLESQPKQLDNHLYAYEAALIAKKANVKELLLTHFWPEIDKQKYVDEASTIFENVHAASEGEIIKIGGITK